VSVWTGWQSDLLDQANVPDSRLNRSFLTAWQKSQPTNCRRNPLFISHKEPGSTNCRKSTTVNLTAQNYDSLNAGKRAFAAQLHSGKYPHLLAALKSGDPYKLTGTDAGDVGADLAAWGSERFAQQFVKRQTQPSGTLDAPQAMKGWQSIRKAVNRGMPAALGNAEHVTAASLRTLHRARKVRL